MSYLNKDAYINKQNWAHRKNAETSAEAVGSGSLTEEQTEVIERICEIRHIMHCMSEQAVFNRESADFTEFRDLFEEISKLIEDLNLIPFSTIDIDEMPDSSDYDYCLDDEERAEWDQKAEAANKARKGVLKHTGFSFWIENSTEFTDFCKMKEQINNDVERWLKAIDNMYGTDYCPTGATRI